MSGAKDVLDFIVIGAQKCGTTSLFEHLRLHPEISLPAAKEAPYFSNDGIFELGWDAYMRKLALVDPGRKWGTVTPNNMMGGVYLAKAGNPAANRYDERTVPTRIRAQLPDVRLIAILRDPVERALSHYRMQVLDGKEHRTCDKAFARLLRPERLERVRTSPGVAQGYVTWGEYGRVLAGYLDVFPAEQLLVLFTDELERDPASLLERIHRFIGVSADFEPDNLGKRYRVGAVEPRFAPMGLNARFSPQGVQRRLTANARTRALWNKLPQAAQRLVRHPYERLAYQLRLWNRRADDADGDAGSATVTLPSEEILERLREHYASDAEILVERLGVTPPWLMRETSSAAP